MMGVETPILPLRIDAAAVDGALPRRIRDSENLYENFLAPPCPEGALMRGPLLIFL